MLFLVPLAAPVHAANGSAPTITVAQHGYNPIYAADDTWVSLTISNPATNQFAITSFTVTVPNSNWFIDDCEDGSILTNCTVSGTDQSALFQVETNYPPLAPGTADVVYIEVYSPLGSASLTYPFSGSFTTTVQDQSSANYYTGPKASVQVIADSSDLGLTVTPGGSNTATSYTAGTAPYTVSAQLTCSTSEPGCTTGYENGVTIGWLQSGYSVTSVYSFGQSSQTTSGSGSSAGTVSTTFQPSNIAGDSTFVAPFIGVYSPENPYECYVSGSYLYCYDFNYICEYVQCPTSSYITTVPGSPSSVGFTFGGSAFPSTVYLTDKGTSVTHTAGYPSGYTGAQLCSVVGGTCLAGNVTAQKVGVSVTDKFGNAIAFGAGGVTFTGSQGIKLQTASGAVFDQTGLPSLIGPFTPTGAFTVPDNYYQSSVFGTAGVITATITGTYGSGTFSVSGSSGTIQTSTFASTGTFQNSTHLDLPPTMIQAGKSLTFDVVLGVAQKNVPITVAVCVHSSCGSTTKGYSGTIAAASGVTNSSGIFSASLAVDTVAGHVAVLNATVSKPITGTPKNTFVIGPSNTTTTIAGAAAKFTVVVGVGSSLDPSPITASFPSATDYVNVVTSDTYGNPVATAGAQQVQINLVANPNTISVTSAYIPQGCWETNGTLTADNGCTGSFNSFGPIAWTLPSSVGSTATISASGVLNGVVVTSPTTTITIVSKTPLLSVTSPKPVNNVIYSDAVNVQFRGWANASAGYNGVATMSSLGWRVGSGSWQTTGLSNLVNSQWSVIATLPTGLSTVTFNATDSKSNVVVSAPYQVLVDTATPTITPVTANGATLNPGQTFSATIVVAQGDLNATSVSVSVNGTALASSNVAVAGTNKLGSSVTYTLTAVLPTGYDNVQVSASTLAGLSSTSTTEQVTVTVAFGNSITFNTATATYGTVGAYKGVTVSVTNSWSTPQTVVVFATLKSGSSIYVAQGTVTLNPGQTASVFCADLQTVPPGTYSVTFSAVTTSNLPVSAPTTAITVTAT